MVSAAEAVPGAAMVSACSGIGGTTTFSVPRGAGGLDVGQSTRELTAAQDVLLAKMLLSHGTADVCLLGGRGVGKTAVVEEFASRWAFLLLCRRGLTIPCHPAQAISACRLALYTATTLVLP